MGVVTFLDLSLFQSGGGGGDPTKFAPRIIWSGDTVILDANTTKQVAVDAPDGDAWTITSEVDGFTPVSGTGATFAYVTFPENTGETAREIVLVVTGQYGSNSITITQRGPLYLVATYFIDNVGEQEIFDSGYYMGRYDYFTVDEDPTHVTGYTYNFQTTGEHTLTFHVIYDGIRNYFIGNVTSLNIPDIELTPSGAFLGMTGLTSVVYAGKEITRNAFSGCTSLTSFTAPNMEIIREHAFDKCSSLTSIDLTNVKRIDNYGLGYCTSLTALTIPDNCQTDYSIINNCSGLTELHIGSGVTSFSITNYITAITVGDQTAIGTWQNKTNLLTLELGNNCTIPNNCLSGCTALTGATIGTLTAIPQAMFYGCTSLTTLKWKNGENIIGQDGVVTISPEVTSIGISAFTNDSAITTVEFVTGDSYCDIYNGVWAGCSGMTSINLGNRGRINTSANAFRNCRVLSTITGLSTAYPEDDGTVRLRGSALMNAYALSSINGAGGDGTLVIPEGFTHIGTRSIEKGGISASTAVTTIDLPSTLVDFANNAISGTQVTAIICRATTAPTISNGSTFAGLSASGTLYTPADADYSTWLVALGEGWTQETISA